MNEYCLCRNSEPIPNKGSATAQAISSNGGASVTTGISRSGKGASSVPRRSYTGDTADTGLPKPNDATRESLSGEQRDRTASTETVKLLSCFS